MREKWSKSLAKAEGQPVSRPVLLLIIGNGAVIRDFEM